jgi:hypothetical protein
MNMEISESDRMKAGFEAVRAAFESTYDCLGINCAQIGGIILSGTEYYEEFKPCGKVSKGSCYNAKGDHSVECNMAEADCGGSWYMPGFVSSRSGCCHCEGSCPAMGNDKCKYHDATTTVPMVGTDTGAVATTTAVAGAVATTTTDSTVSGSIHMQSSSALVMGVLFLAYVGGPP